ncbi:hypothetical protein BDP27DRAFT_1367203 [Rhodocollybia butyracea]|uniref:Uncharacterized protein n=1 Tax=Rhodocollybia butyracea TaxID=206335 RepID=A0A9P5PKY6_9AGAR|nr:hypothetical protein BDP27DRAFT_1367203 [Rhodocollybia butyracea]
MDIPVQGVDLIVKYLVILCQVPMGIQVAVAGLVKARPKVLNVAHGTCNLCAEHILQAEVVAVPSVSGRRFGMRRELDGYRRAGMLTEDWGETFFLGGGSAKPGVILLVKDGRG